MRTHHLQSRADLLQPCLAQLRPQARRTKRILPIRSPRTFRLANGANRGGTMGRRGGHPWIEWTNRAPDSLVQTSRQA